MHSFLLKERLAPLNANVFSTALPILGNTDAILFICCLLFYATAESQENKTYWKWLAISPVCTINVSSVLASFWSLCFSACSFLLPIVSASLYHVHFSELHGIKTWEVFHFKPQLCLYFYLSKVSCLCCLSKFCFCILQFFLCSCSNYLEAFKCLNL